MNDIISRQAAINALSNMMDTDGFRDGWAVSRANVDCMLRSLPPAQSEITNEETRFALKQLEAYFSIKIRDKKEGDVPVELLQRIKEIQEYVDDLPSAQRWIPCKTALPKENGQYIVTVKYEHVDGYEDIYSEHGEWVDGHWDAGFGHCGKVEKVLAWMPLPEPYKAERK